MSVQSLDAAPEKPLMAYLAWAAICVIWGTTYLANTVAIQSVPPLIFCGVRFLTAGLLLQTFLVATGRTSREARVPLRLKLAGIPMLGLGTGMVVWSQQWLASRLASVLVASTPFLMVSLEAIIPGGTRPSRRAVAGLVFGLMGVLLIALRQPAEAFRADYLWAVGAVLLAELGWAFGSILTKRHKHHGDQFAVAAQQMLCGGAALVLGGMLVGEHISAVPPVEVAVAFAYLVVFGSLIAFVSYLYALKQLPVAFVSTYMYVNPVLALWLGWLVLGEVLNHTVLIATALVFTGLTLTRERRRRKPNTGEEKAAGRVAMRDSRRHARAIAGRLRRIVGKRS